MNEDILSTSASKASDDEEVHRSDGMTANGEVRTSRMRGRSLWTQGEAEGERKRRKEGKGRERYGES